MKKIFVLLLTLISGLVICPSVSQAGEFNFAVNPVIPENQVDKSVSYFDLLLGENQKQELQVALKNDTEQAVVVDVDLANATTNTNGVVEYSPNKIPADPSLKYQLSDIAEAPKSITVPANGQTELKINLTMPTESFAGVIAGGITLSQHKEAEKEENQAAGVSIKNEFSYVIGLVVRENEQKVEPNLLLNDVKPDQLNARNVIVSSLQNDQATYINQVAIDGVVTKQGNSKALYKVNQSGMQIAPNSGFAFPLPLNGEKLEAGRYHMKLTVYGNKNEAGKYEQKTGEKFDHRWVLEKDFVVTEKTADKLNKQDVTIKEENNWWIYLLIGIIILLLVLIVLLLVFLRKKKEEDNEKEKNS